MVPFLPDACASDGSVTCDTAAPAATDYWVGPQRYGAAKVFVTTEAVAGTDTFNGGLRYTSEGVLRVYNATGGLPAGAVYIGGCAVSSDGQLCVTTASPGVTTQFIGGNAVTGGAVNVTGLFSPLDLSPAAWYRYGVGVTEAGGFASLWADQSGNGRDLAQATGTNQPAYSGGIFTFDGVDNWMRATFTLNQPTQIFIRLKALTWTESDGVLDGAPTGYRGALYQGPAASSPNLIAYAGGSSLNTNPDLALDTYGTITLLFNGAGSYIKTDASAAVTGNAGALNMGGITLGKLGGASSLYSNIEVKELCIFAAEISGDDLTNMLTYMAAL